MDQVLQGQTKFGDCVERPEINPDLLSPLDIHVRFQPVLNQALVHNSVPVLCELVLENRSDRSFSEVTLSLASDPPVLHPRLWTIQQIAPGQIRSVRDIEVKLDAAFVGALTEAALCTATLTAHAGPERLAARQEDIRLLPPNFWGGVVGLPDILAAYVEPNDPAVARIIHSASDLLRAQSKPDSYEGYQSGDKIRVWQQASAIWGAVCALDIRYVNAPPSFEETGQRIRPPRQIVEERLANCLDATLLFAACLESAGLNPVIILIHDHAFAGVWYSDRKFSQPLAGDPASLRNSAALDDLLLFEATLCTQARKPGLRAAQSAAMDHLDPAKDNAFDSVIDIAAARRRRIRPLQGIIQSPAPESDIETGAAPPIEEPPPLRPDDVTEAAPTDTIPLNRLDRWRQRLLDLTGRNRLLNMPQKSKQVLAIDCPDIGQLENLLAEMRTKPSMKPLRFIAEPKIMSDADPRNKIIHTAKTDEDARRAFALESLASRELIGRANEPILQTTLTEIYRAARANQQEGGANTLFLTLGSLLWRKADKEKPYHAPLILVPVVLERQSIRSAFTLRIHDEETRLNATLFEMLRQDFDIHFPGLLENPPTDESGWDVGKILDIVRGKLRNIPGWEVAESACLTNLSFAKYLMWKDLTDRVEALKQNRTVQLLLDEQKSDGDAPQVRPEGPEHPDLDHELTAANLVCPLEADSSQARAVARAASGVSFVMIGPPGTGKSQTIANIIANTLAQGKTVLFVAEKRAALEVVQRRLAQVELADFCLDLFSAKSSKSAVLRQLDRARNVLEDFRRQDWTEANAAANALRAELNGYVGALHDRAANGWTAFRAMGIVLRAEDEALPVLSLNWPRRDMHDAAAYQRLVELAEEAAAAWARTGAAIAKARLSGIETLAWSPPWEQRLLDAAHAATAALRKLETCAAAVAEQFGLPQRPSGAALAARLPLCTLMLEAPAMDAGWALADHSSAMLGTIRAEAGRVKRHGQLVQALTAKWHAGTAGLPDASRRAACQEAVARLQALTDHAAQAASALGLPSRTSRAALDALDAACALLREAPRRQAAWALTDDAPVVLQWLRDDAGGAERHRSLRKELASVWRPAAMILPLSELSAAWNDAAVKWLLPRKLGLAALRKRLAPVIDGAVPEGCGPDLARLAEMQVIERQVEASKAASRVGGHWQGLETDFAALEASYRWSRQLRDALACCAETGEFGEQLLTYVRTMLEENLEMLAPEGQFGAIFLTLATARTACVAAAGGVLPDDAQDELGRLTELLAIETHFDVSPLGAMVGPRWQRLETDFTRLEAGFAWAGRLRAAMAATVSDPVALIELRRRLGLMVTEGADLLGPDGSVGQALRSFRDAWSSTLVALDAVSSLCGSPPGEFVAADVPDWTEALAEVFTSWKSDARSLRDWCSWRGLCRKAASAGLSPVLSALADGLVAPDDALRMFEAAYARWWIGLAVEETPRLRDFAASTHEQRIERFRALDKRMLGLASRLVRLCLAGQIQEDCADSRNPEYALLNHELQKRQRHIPVRQLALKMPRALRRLTPCLMMSPLSVAQFLPATSEPFDLVIFDEASQIATWDAIGAIGRGRQVIVVGDQQQLPPSDFFQRQAADDETVAAGQEDLDSVLDECRGRGMTELELSWHYRSRHESLIAFSNHTYYGGRLITFPSPVTEDQAVSFRFIEAGVYGKAGARTNPAEAQAVVAEALRRLRAAPDEARVPSIGIVTFNAQQQDLIENLLDEERRRDPSLEPFFSDTVSEPVMIRNLEGVQGEERDVMLFSLTYGPDAVGRMGMNFGPLNNTGGERRLNVAITRARSELMLFGSFRPEQMDLARTNAQGVRHLKQFMIYAEHGARTFVSVEDTGTGDFESPFEAAVAARLKARGWEIRSQIGVSGFRVDLGIVDPDAPGRYLAGVECDGATYHRSATARDRDRLRQAVLEGLGWQILRIWSTDWWGSADRETERLHAALTGLLAANGAKRRMAADVSLVKETAEPIAAESEIEPVLVQSASLPPTEPADIRADAAAFYDIAYRPVLTAMINDILAEQGPLRADVLAHLVARRHGFKRTGGDIRDRVLAALPGECAQTSDGVGRFIWPGDALPEQWSRFRNPVLGQSRDPTEMPLEELVVLAGTVLEKSQDEESVLLAMRDACGLQRLRERSRTRCLEAIALAKNTSSGR